MKRRTIVLLFMLFFSSLYSSMAYGEQYDLKQFTVLGNQIDEEGLLNSYQKYEVPRLDLDEYNTTNSIALKKFFEKSRAASDIVSSGKTDTISGNTENIKKIKTNPEIFNLIIKDKELKKRYKDLLKADLEYQIFALEKKQEFLGKIHLRNLKLIPDQEFTFFFQRVTAIIIFTVVHIITGLGIVFSIKEFLKYNKLIANTKPENEIHVSMEGIILKSKYFGVIMLFLSICFYFLYLKFVFSISVLRI